MIQLPAMSDRDRRTARIAAVAIAIYLALFGGYKVWSFCAQQRADYRELQATARELRDRAVSYQQKALVVKKMMDDYHLDPARLPRETVVAGASAAIQQAAQAGGFAVGSIRETAARGSGRAMATVQLEGVGPASAALSFLAGLNTIGFPLLVDSVQFTSLNGGPGMVKMSLTIVILDFSKQPETSEVPHA